MPIRPLEGILTVLLHNYVLYLKTADPSDISRKLIAEATTTRSAVFESSNVTLVVNLM